MAFDTPTLGEKIRYQVDRFLSWHPIARFLALFILSFALILFTAVLAKMVMPAPEDPNDSFDLGEALWWALTRVADAGTMGDDKGTLVRFVAILATISGVVVVALLIGLVSGTVGEKIEGLRKGKSPVIDSNHTLILGYGEKIFALLKELREANANQKQALVVILSQTDKEEVEAEIRERLEDMKSTRVIVRQGSPFSVHDLKKVGAGRAKSIVVLSIEQEGQPGAAEQADMDAIKTLLALRRIDGALKNNHVVVELQNGARQEVAEQLGAGGVEVVAMAETLSRMMVQTARQNGLAQVYREILTYAGSEFYYSRAPGLAGTTFGQAQWRINGAVLCGLRRAGAVGAKATVLNPNDAEVIGTEDELLLLSEDDDTFSFNAKHQPVFPTGFQGAPALTQQAEKLLICGSSPKLGDMLKEFDNYLVLGSEVWLMPGLEKEAFLAAWKDTFATLKKVKVRFVEGSPASPEALRKTATSDLSVAMVVANTALPHEEADAHTVMTVLLLREVFKQFGDGRPRLISEILDPRTKDLLEHEYGADFVVSSEMTSMLLAQVSERRELNAVFGDLFDADGNEIYLKRAACFAPLGHNVPWLSIQKVARSRKEIAIGYLKFGQGPHLNPPQDTVLVFANEDRVIVIAEDDNEGPVAVPTVPLATVAGERNARSPLLPPDDGGKKVPARAAFSEPRLQGPSNMPREPLPKKKP